MRTAILLSGSLLAFALLAPSASAIGVCVPAGVLGYEGTCVSVYGTHGCAPRVDVYLSDPDGSGSQEVASVCVPPVT